MRIWPRMRAWTFCSVRSPSGVPEGRLERARKAACIGSMGISRKAMPRLARRATRGVLARVVASCSGTACATPSDAFAGRAPSAARQAVSARVDAAGEARSPRSGTRTSGRSRAPRARAPGRPRRPAPSGAASGGGGGQRRARPAPSTRGAAAVEVGDDERLLEERRARQHAAVGADEHRPAVEDQRVVPAHLVHVGDGRAVARAPLAASIRSRSAALPQRVGRGRDVHDELARRRRRGRRWGRAS